MSRPPADKGWNADAGGAGFWVPFVTFMCVVTVAGALLGCAIYNPLR